MITRRGLLAAPLLAAPTTGCIVPEYRTRYRLVISGLFEGRPVSGASVMESVLSDPNHWWTGGVLIGRYRGESTIIPLKGDRVLVAIMRQWNPGQGSAPFLSYEPGWRPSRALASLSSADRSWTDGRNAAEEQLSRLRTSAAIPVDPESLPAMVVFENRHDPSSIQLLPYGSVGPAGFNLSRAAVEITHDRIFTDKPLETFPWLKHYSNRIDIGQGVYARDILQRKLTR